MFPIITILVQYHVSFGSAAVIDGAAAGFSVKSPSESSSYFLPQCLQMHAMQTMQIRIRQSVNKAITTIIEGSDIADKMFLQSTKASSESIRTS